MKQQDIHQQAQNISAELIAIRRHLHQHPELSFQEYETQKFVKSELEKIGFQNIITKANTGLVVTIEGKNPTKKCIALRADMDALPIQELNDAPYKSQNDGVMHACGHDVHTTCLLGAAKILFPLKDQMEGTIKFIFQPGEEVAPGGASIMIKEGVLENPKPESIIGLHVFPDLPAGQVGFKSGQYMASSDEIFITVKGKGGHAALPHKVVDPIVVAANIIISLQQITSRKCNPIVPNVLSFGKIQGGFTNNVIPNEVHLEGTLRTFDEVWRKEALAFIKNISESIATSFGATAEVTIPDGYPSLYNAPELTAKMETYAKEYLGEEQVKPLEIRMTAEDFSFYAQKVDGCFYRLGTNQNNIAKTTPVHTAYFDVDESCLSVGAGLMAWLAIQELRK